MQSKNLTTELQAEDLKRDMNDIDEENKELDKPSDQQDPKHGSSQSLGEAEQKKEHDFDLESGLIKY